MPSLEIMSVHAILETVGNLPKPAIETELAEKKVSLRCDHLRRKNEGKGSSALGEELFVLLAPRSYAIEKESL